MAGGGRLAAASSEPRGGQPGLGVLRSLLGSRSAPSNVHLLCPPYTPSLRWKPTDLSKSSFKHVPLLTDHLLALNLLGQNPKPLGAGQAWWPPADRLPSGPSCARSDPPWSRRCPPLLFSGGRGCCFSSPWSGAPAAGSLCLITVLFSLNRSLSARLERELRGQVGSPDVSPPASPAPKASGIRQRCPCGVAQCRRSAKQAAFPGSF